MCELLVGLPEVDVRGVVDQAGTPLVVHVESRLDQRWCRQCGVRGQIKDWTAVEFVDLPCFGRPTRLVWHKQRWRCPETRCPAGSWTVLDPRIAWPRAALTDRAARWATWHVGCLGRSVNEVAVELGCDWHTVNDAVLAYGEALLAADADRVGAVDAVGLDETLFFRQGPKHLKQWATSVVDVGGPGRAGRLIEVIEGRTATTVSDWLDAQPAEWRTAISYGVLDMSRPYPKVLNDSLDHVTRRFTSRLRTTAAYEPSRCPASSSTTWETDQGERAGRRSASSRERPTPHAPSAVGPPAAGTRVRASTDLPGLSSGSRRCVSAAHVGFPAVRSWRSCRFVELQRPHQQGRPTRLAAVRCKVEQAWKCAGELRTLV